MQFVWIIAIIGAVHAIFFSDDKSEPNNNFQTNSSYPSYQESRPSYYESNSNSYDSEVSSDELENPYDEGSGHSAGYEWAEENDVDECGGNSESFIEGCQEYLDQKEEQN